MSSYRFRPFDVEAIQLGKTRVDFWRAALWVEERDGIAEFEDGYAVDQNPNALRVKDKAQDSTSCRVLPSQWIVLNSSDNTFAVLWDHEFTKIYEEIKVGIDE